jgi:hypothetical protein
MLSITENPQLNSSMEACNARVAKTLSYSQYQMIFHLTFQFRLLRITDRLVFM